MRQKTEAKTDFPEWFRRDVIEELVTTLEHCDGIQVIGGPGAGKTSLGVQISSMSLAYYFVYVNLDLINLGSNDELVKILSANFRDNTAYFLDPFERIIESKNKSILALLEGWRRENFGKVKYIFGLENWVIDKEELSKLEPISKLLTQCRLQLPLLKRNETDWFALNTASKYRIDISDEELVIIWQLSGGYMQLVKKLVLAKGKGFNLNSPDLVMEDTEVRYLVEKIKQYQENRHIKTPLLKFCHQKSSLTQREEKLYSYLGKNKDQICSRDRLIEEIWGKEKAGEVNDHSLDQLIFRLKKKLGKNNRSRVETVRGRGVRLTD